MTTPQQTRNKLSPFILLFTLLTTLWIFVSPASIQGRTFNGYPIGDEVLFPPAGNLRTGAEITGALRQWHKVTLTIDGPRASQYGTTMLEYDAGAKELYLDVRPQGGPPGRLGYMHPNPFLDYRMTVIFTHESGLPRYEVPGYFAADGNAAETGAMSGNKWRAHLSPDKTGRWDWEVSFVAGVNISVEQNAPFRAWIQLTSATNEFFSLCY